MEKICIECGENPRTTGRRYCRPCYLERKRQQAKKRFAENGRYTYTKVCKACKKEYKACKKSQKFCSKCWKLRSKLAREEFEKEKSQCYGGHSIVYKEIVENILGRPLEYGEVVHHLDGNPSNNELNNLIVMTVSAHIRLHKFLDDNRVIWEKSQNENSVNCWNNLRASITTTWLETANVMCLKIWEIGQSAAKPLSS